MKKTLFYEQQRFNQWWLWAILLVPSCIVVYNFFAPLFADVSNSSGNFSFSMAMPRENWIVLFILIVVLFFFLFLQMKTNIDADKVVVKHLYFVKKEWKWSEIKSAKIIKYGFVGYGIRLSLNHGTLYNIKGNKGLLIQLKNGKKRLIGTQKPEELAKVISAILK